MWCIGSCPKRLPDVATLHRCQWGKDNKIYCQTRLLPHHNNAQRIWNVWKIFWNYGLCFYYQLHYHCIIEWRFGNKFWIVRHLICTVFNWSIFLVPPILHLDTGIYVPKVTGRPVEICNFLKHQFTLMSGGFRYGSQCHHLNLVYHTIIMLWRYISSRLYLWQIIGMLAHHE